MPESSRPLVSLSQPVFTYQLPWNSGFTVTAYCAHQEVDQASLQTQRQVEFV
jgi:hypothetical protein